jgi:hypothetical protein
MLQPVRTHITNNRESESQLSHLTMFQFYSYILLGLIRFCNIRWYVGYITSATASSNVRKTICGISSGFKPPGAVVLVHKQSGNKHF